MRYEVPKANSNALETEALKGKSSSGLVFEDKDIQGNTFQPETKGLICHNEKEIIDIMALTFMRIPNKHYKIAIMLGGWDGIEWDGMGLRLRLRLLGYPRVIEL